MTSSPDNRFAKRVRTIATLVVFGLGVSSPASAEPDLLAGARIVRHFAIDAGQQPENLAAAPDGSINLSFSFSRTVSRLAPGGGLTTLATLPAPPSGTEVPLTGRAFVGGIVQGVDGSVYVAYAAGTNELTGVWRIQPGHAPSRITALPAEGLPNGMALSGSFLYTTDSVRGIVWRSPLAGGPAEAWSTDAALSGRPGTFGVNGIKVRGGAVWVTNYDKGTWMKIPFNRRGGAAPARLVAADLGEVDDFAFTGNDDDALITANPGNAVLLVRADGQKKTVLTAADGLQNPTSLLRRGHLVYVASAGYFTGTDPKRIALIYFTRIQILMMVFLLT
jgi:hypothetical protein